MWHQEGKCEKKVVESEEKGQGRNWGQKGAVNRRLDSNVVAK